MVILFFLAFKSDMFFSISFHLLAFLLWSWNQTQHFHGGYQCLLQPIKHLSEIHLHLFHWNLKTIAHLHFRYHLVHDHVVRLLFFSKHTLVSPYCMHSLLILTAFWFASVIVFYYYSIFFLCPLCSNPPHRLFITLTRIAWIASGEGIRLLVVEASSSWKVQPLTVEMSAYLGLGLGPVCRSLRLLTYWESLISSTYEFC